METRPSRAVAAAAFGLAVAACAGPTHQARTSPNPTRPVSATTAADGTQAVTIDATNTFRFEPSIITAHPGRLEVTLVDSGSYPHNLAVHSLHFTSKTVSGGLGKDKTTFTLTFDKPGSYSFECTFHSSAGMRGTFVVG